jgi:hypothetical protein
MNGKKITIVVMAGALIFSLERLIAQRSMVFEVGADPVAMCHCCAACFVRIGATPRICERR